MTGRRPRPPNITIMTERNTCMNYRMITAIALGLALAFAGTLFAHGDAIHVTGIVRAVTADSLTVETAKHEMITVLCTPKMEVTRSKVKADIKDLKVGDRVVIHAMKDEKGKLVAEEVAFGPAAPATAVAKH
jgi:Cu/Ag efflux protein CusF